MTSASFDLNEILESDLDTRVELLKEWKKHYYKGTPIVEDDIYDAVEETIPANHPFKKQVGFTIDDDRKEKLPIPMFSMDKLKTLEEIFKWLNSNNISDTEPLILTPKFDGGALSVNLKNMKAWTRGDGTYGQTSEYHLNELMKRKKKKITQTDDDYYISGETIIRIQDFEEKYMEDYANPRNFVTGLFNSKDIKKALQDVQFMSYSVDDDSLDKDKMLDYLNQNVNNIPVPYVKITKKDLQFDVLHKYYTQWKEEFELDGLILEVNDKNIREKLGRETNMNPRFAKALKIFKTDTKTTQVLMLEWGVSKEGNLCPVAILNPVNLRGVTISRVTCNNAKYVDQNKIGEGSLVDLIRSGDVIPKIIKVITSSESSLPTVCPSCNTKVLWDETGTHLFCPNHEKCPAQRLAKIVAFYRILEVEDVSEGILEQLYNCGYDTVDKIINMTEEQASHIEGFGRRKSQIVVGNIREKLSDIPLEKLQHASGLFKGLGSKKLALLKHFNDKNVVHSVSEIVKIDGFSDKSAKVYVDNIGKFWKFIEKLPITVKQQVKKGNSCEGMGVVFTQVRDAELETFIEERGGKVISSVSKKTTHLIHKVGADTSKGKMSKARDINNDGGNIKVMDIDSFRELLGVSSGKVEKIAAKVERSEEDIEGLFR